MPRDFFTDFVKVAQDEGRHFTLLAERLEELGSFYGALPAHDGLWDSATATSNDLLARLAVEHCVHEVFFPYQLSYFKMNHLDQHGLNFSLQHISPLGHHLVDLVFTNLVSNEFRLSALLFKADGNYYYFFVHTYIW